MTLVGLVALWATGALLLALLGCRDGRSPDAIAADFVAGVCVLAFTGMTTLALGGSLSTLIVYGPLGVLVAFAVLHRPDLRTRFELPAGSGGRVPLALSGGTLGVLLVASLRDRLWWDGWAAWAFKARVLFVDKHFPAAFLEPGGAYQATNLDYPLSVPLLSWWLYEHARQALPGLTSFVGGVWLVMIALLTWGALRARTTAVTTGLAVLGVCLFWPLSYFATGGTADVVVALALAGAVVELERAVSRRDRRALVRLTIYLTLAALTKNEGLALAVIGAALVPIAVWQARHRWRWVWIGAVPFAALAPWFVFTRTRGLAAGAMASSAVAGHRGARLDLLLAQFVDLLGQPVWLPVLPLLLLGLVLTGLRRHSYLVTPWAFALAYLGALAAVYVTTGADLNWLLHTSQPRVFATVVPSLAILACLACAEPALQADAALSKAPR